MSKIIRRVLPNRNVIDLTKEEIEYKLIQDIIQSKLKYWKSVKLMGRRNTITKFRDGQMVALVLFGASIGINSDYYGPNSIEEMENGEWRERLKNYGG